MTLTTYAPPLQGHRRNFAFAPGSPGWSNFPAAEARLTFLAKRSYRRCNTVHSRQPPWCGSLLPSRSWPCPPSGGPSPCRTRRASARCMLLHLRLQALIRNHKNGKNSRGHEQRHFVIGRDCLPTTIDNEHLQNKRTQCNGLVCKLED